MDTAMMAAGIAKAMFRWSSTRKMLISAATMAVRLVAILTTALARLRRSGAMKSGTSASAMGLKVLATSA